MRPERVVVVVPARDEERDLPACLAGLLVAVANSPVPAWIVVVDDASLDATAEVARTRLAPPHRVVVGPGRDVGSARRHGVAVAVGDDVDPRRVWVASTDADTVVPPDWLVRQVGHATAGTDAVAGVVTLGDAPAALAAAFRTRYGHRSGGPHPHLHAANLGIRLSTLRAAGSWQPVGHAEEHDLWRRLPPGAQVVADSSLVVTTSARLHGRAPIGFADDLARLWSSVGAVG